MGRYDQPCGHWLGDEDRFCGVPRTIRFLTGRRCVDHQPARVYGHPDPPKPDPALSLAGLRDRAGRRGAMTPAGSTLVDERAVASGKRRSSPNTYRAARDAEEARRAVQDSLNRR